MATSPAPAPQPPDDAFAKIIALLEAANERTNAGATLTVGDAPDSVLAGTLIHRGLNHAGTGLATAAKTAVSPWISIAAVIALILTHMGVLPTPFVPKPVPVPGPTPQPQPQPQPKPPAPDPQPQPNPQPLPTPPPVVLNSPVALATKAMLADQARAYRAVKAKLQAGSIQKTGIPQALMTEKTPLAQSLADQINAAPDTAGALEDVAKVFEGAKIP